jgi:hypothetical protein
VFVQEADDPAVLAGIELVELVDGEHEIAFGDLQSCFELARVGEVIDVDLSGAGDGLHRLGVVVHVVPADRIA